MGGVVSEVSLVVEVELVLLWSIVLSSGLVLEVVWLSVEADLVSLVSTVLSSELVLEVITLSVEAESVLLVSMVFSSVVLFEVILVVDEGDVALEVSPLVAEVELVMSLVVSVGAGLEIIVVVEVVLLGASVMTSEVSSGRAFSEEVMSASCAPTTTAPFAINRRPAINASVKRLGDMLPPR